MSKFLVDANIRAFSDDLAAIIGLYEAIILQQVHYWIRVSSSPTTNQNFAYFHETHFREGYYWIYNSYSNWGKQFKSFSERTIRRTIQSLEDQGLLISGNFNKDRRDRSKWYRINYQALDKLELEQDSILSKQNDFPHLPKEDDACGQIGHMRQNADSEDFACGQIGHMQLDNLARSYKEQRLLTNNKKNIIYIKKNPDSDPNLKKEKVPKEPDPVDYMIESWNKTVEECGGTKCKLAGEQTRKKAKSRYRELGKEGWDEILALYERSPFLRGENKDGWKANFVWVLKPENIEKIMNGAYIPSKETSSQTGSGQTTQSNGILSLNKNSTKEDIIKVYNSYLQKNLHAPEDAVKSFFKENLGDIGLTHMIRWFNDEIQ